QKGEILDLKMSPSWRGTARAAASAGGQASRQRRGTMRTEVLVDANAVARKAATMIAAEARQAVAARGRFVMAVSGGHTPWVMLRALAEEDVPWASVHIFQVDERVAPEGHADRNLTHLRESLLEHAPLPAGQIYAMPVEMPDLQSAAA